jgi:hypothetical protein
MARTLSVPWKRRRSIAGSWKAGTRFRDPAIPKGRMNIKAENGVVMLRRVADSRDQIERIMAATVAIDGVRPVRSLLRTPDEQPAHSPSDRSGETVSSGSGG